MITNVLGQIIDFKGEAITRRELFHQLYQGGQPARELRGIVFSPDPMSLEDARAYPKKSKAVREHLCLMKT